MQNPYSAPSASSLSEPSGEYVVPIEGVDGRVSVLPDGSMFSAGRLLLDGKPPERSWRKGYRLPLRDGTSVWAQLRQSWTRPVPIVIVNARRYEMGPKIGWGYAVCIFLPFTLIFAGGLLGGLFGGLGCAVNRKVAFSQNPGWLRVALMLGVVLGTFGLYALCAGLLYNVTHPR